MDKIVIKRRHSLHVILYIYIIQLHSVGLHQLLHTTSTHSFIPYSRKYGSVVIRGIVYYTSHRRVYYTSHWIVYYTSHKIVYYTSHWIIFYTSHRIILHITQDSILHITWDSILRIIWDNILHIAYSCSPPETA